MSSIGSGSGLASGATIDVTTALQVGSTDTRQSTTLDTTATATQAATSTQTASTATSTTDSTAPAVATTTTTSAGTIPENSDRVAAIKKAIEEGNYPIVPTQIGDAMIAASMLWRSPK